MKLSNPMIPKRTQRDYTLGFKLSVVEQVEAGQLTYKQAQQKYGIQGRSTVLVWLRKHGKLDWSSSGGRAMKHQETPEQTIKRLQKELQDAKDLNYLQHEMLKEMDRITGSHLEKKYLSERQKLRKRRGG